MPKEFRKRGKRSKRQKESDTFVVYAKPDEVDQPEPEETSSRPTVSQGRLADIDADGAVAQDGTPAVNTVAESIWPAVHPDTKAYFQQLEERIIQLEQLQAYGRAAALNVDGDNEDVEMDDRVLLLRAALTELSGKETAVAADPETSVILERLIFSMDDFARRVLADRFTGDYTELAKDRFASHVLQALLILGGGETVERERKGKIAAGPAFGRAESSNDTGELPSMTQSIMSITKELLPKIPELITSQHGSYVLRTLLLVLSGKPLPFDSQSSADGRGAMSRSKKSAKWKASRGAAMRSFMPTTGSVNYDTKGKGTESRIVPVPFSTLLASLVEAIDRALCDGQPKQSKAAAQACRQKSDDPVATGLVQILLELENDRNESQSAYSLMDRLLDGLILQQSANMHTDLPPRSDFIETLLRSTVSSHVLELLVSLCPVPIYDIFFKSYFQTRVARLAGHPVANFVVIRVVERCNKEQLEIIVDEVQEALSGMIENSRTGTLKILLDKAVELNTRQKDLSQMLKAAFHIRTDEEIQHLVPCGLLLMTLSLFRRNPAFNDLTVKPEFLTQGAVLLQAWLRVHGSPVIQSILALPIDRLLLFTSDPIASRIIDVFLDENNSAVPRKHQVAFLKGLIGHYHRLADDRIGSRVAERCWSVADPFLRAKIADSLQSHEQQLHGSQFGHYFLRKVNLPLYRRDPRDWRDKQSRDVGGTPAELYAQAAKQKLEDERKAYMQAQIQASRTPMPSNPVIDVAANNATDINTEQSAQVSKKKRKKVAEVDEIEDLFKFTKRGKQSSHATKASTASKKVNPAESAVSGDLDSVIKAIRATKA